MFHDSEDLVFLDTVLENIARFIGRYSPMQSSHRVPSHSRFSERDHRSAGSDLIVGVATLSLLTVLKGGRILSQGLQSLGQWSEELFRGDRLPNLDFSHPIVNDPAASIPSSDASPSEMG